MFVRTRKWAITALFIGWLVSCGGQVAQKRLDAEYGSAAPKSRLVDEPVKNKLDYALDVKPIIDARCVSCHGCYDAPCQLKLTAIEGIERGATKNLVYESSRMVAADPTRLFEDAHSTTGWRAKDFFPVLNERNNVAEANREASVLYQILRLKNEQPSSQTAHLSGYDFSLDRKNTCPTIEEFPDYKKEHPEGGMPYGLPGISTEEFQIIERWLSEGATHSPRPELSVGLKAHVSVWENMLNRDDLKSQLIARYIYEHLFLAHLYFEALGDGAETTFFEMVRSKTAPGRPVERISTRRPHDDPGAERVYYRLIPLRTTVLDKTHMPYALSDERMEHWKKWFYETAFQVDHLPSYAPEMANNPFAAFLQIPVGSRYRFMLDEAQFTLEGFIKGPVCRGQVSLNVINDRFWVYFVRPENIDQAEAQFYAKEIPNLSLPPNEHTGALVLSRWLEYADLEKSYLKGKFEFFQKQYGKPKPVDLDLIWKGDGQNKNATLTVFRHEDSATVVQGTIGSPPKTAWVLGYGLLERIHYLLAADFDVFGNLSHQLVTRVYMDFLRMEAEGNFLGLLPKWSRTAVMSEWYVDAEKEAMPYVLGKSDKYRPETAIRYTSRNPELELFEKLEQELSRVQPDQFTSPEPNESLARLERLVGGPVKLMPQMSLVRIERRDQEAAYVTILRDNDHTNILSIFSEKERRRPERDRLTVVRGILGSYPNALFRVNEQQLEPFAHELGQLKSEQDYAQLREHYGVLRSDQKFWAFSDLVHADIVKDLGFQAGRLDFNRLENR